MDNLTQGGTQSGNFFSKIRAFFSIFKKRRGRPPLALVARLISKVNFLLVVAKQPLWEGWNWYVSVCTNIIYVRFMQRNKLLLLKVLKFSFLYLTFPSHKLRLEFDKRCVFLFFHHIFFYVPKYFKIQNKYSVLIIKVSMTLLFHLVFSKRLKRKSAWKRSFFVIVITKLASEHIVFTYEILLYSGYSMR